MKLLSSTVFLKETTRYVKVEFLPFDTDNPARTLLKDELTRLNLTIEGQGWGESSFGPSYAIRMKKRGVDVAHFHYVLPYVLIGGFIVSLASAIRFVAGLTTLKLLGIKTVWTVNNLLDHERRFKAIDYFSRWCLSLFCTKIIVYCKDSEKQVVRCFGHHNHKKISVIPLGHYKSCYPNTVSNPQARQRFDLKPSDFVFLFFGIMRPYKGIENLMRQFAKITGENTKLILAGSCPDTSYLGSIKQQADKDPRIIPIIRNIANEEIQYLFNSSNVVVFPYERLFTSGAILLAMSYSKPCIAPNLGSIPETLDQKGGFVYDHAKEDGLITAMECALECHAHLNGMGQYNSSKVNTWSWDDIAKQTKNLYTQILI